MLFDLIHVNRYVLRDLCLLSALSRNMLTDDLAEDSMAAEGLMKILLERVRSKKIAGDAVPGGDVYGVLSARLMSVRVLGDSSMTILSERVQSEGRLLQPMLAELGFAKVSLQASPSFQVRPNPCLAAPVVYLSLIHI